MYIINCADGCLTEFSSGQNGYSILGIAEYKACWYKRLDT